MDGFLVSSAVGALKSVLEKLAAVLDDEYKPFKGMHSQVKSLTSELVAMHELLLKMSEEENPDEQDRAWMREVRELSYDIEDSLDEFRLRVDEKSAKLDYFFEKCNELLVKTKNHCRITKAIDDLKTQVEEVADIHARYKICEDILKETHESVDQRALAIFKDASKLVGVDGPKNELIQLLTKGNGLVPLHQPKVVSIVGFGGMGKTTIANQVYSELKGQFECHAFVSVSRNPDVTKVLQTILNEISNQSYANSDTGDMQQLIKKITDFLQDKRYFIVVDDLWNIEAWNTIKCVFANNNHGGKIITTTRIKEVADACCSSFGGHVYNLMPLSDTDSRSLFLNKIFGSEEQCPPHLNVISNEILKKCAGLPLAIIAISGLLASKARTVDQWDQVEKSIGYALERNKDIQYMMGVLSLSFFDLPHLLKPCLLYLSIFPEDYDIEKKPLILRWVAEGFIPEEHGLTLYESGEICFNELINRSLIQPGKIGLFGEVETCRIHDTILDFIISKSKEENFVTLLGVPGANPIPQNKVRRLSLQNDSEVPTNLILSNARSVGLFGYSVKIPFLLVFRHLRVLDFEDCRQLEDHHLAHIGNLVHLRYLRLWYTSITKLPEQIAALQYLQTVYINGANKIIEIPSTITQLGRLVHLTIDDDTILPDEIGSMEALQVLEGVNVYSQSINFVQRLGQLTNLRKLSIEFINSYADDDWEEKVKKMISSLCELGKAIFQSLHVSISEGADEILQCSWCPAPRSLQELVIDRDAVSMVPRWMSSLVNLQKLFINMWEVGQEDVVILGGLPALLHLCFNIWEIEPKRERLRISGSHGFPSLRHLQIGGEECALRLIFESGSMPKLQKLELEFDVEETSSVTNGQFDFRIEHLSCLTSVLCICHYGEHMSPTLKATMEKAIRVHPNHPTLAWM